MAGIRLDAFSGEIPARDVRLLPETAAAQAINVRVESGALEAIRVPRLLKVLQSSTRSVYRIPTGAASDIDAAYWLEFADLYTDVIRTPVINDAYERYYWCSPSTGFRFAPRTALLAGGTAAGIQAGIPRPATAPNLDVIAGTGGVDGAGKPTGERVTRSYLVTFVGEYGEEGAEGPAVEATGYHDQDWRLRDIPQPVTEAGKSAVVTIRVYRTVTGAAGNTSFNRVVDLAVGTTIYIDRLSDLAVGGSPALSDVAADAPQPMDGIALMPNGVMVGFKGNNLYFSDNFRPHAWPAAYTLTVQHKIVGLAVSGNTCVIATEGNPAAVTGNSGAVMSLTQSDTSMPCMERKSIVTAPEGVYWASQDGIVLYGPSGPQFVTDALIGRGRWRGYVPASVVATLVEGKYTFRHVVNFDERCLMLAGDYAVEIDGFLKGGANYSYFGFDVYSGKALLIQQGAGLGLYEFMPTGTPRRSLLWKSKEFHLPVPVSLSVGVCYFDTTVSALAQITVYAGGVQRLFIGVQNGVPFRLPGGFKEDIWQVAISGPVKVNRVILASSVQELKGQ